MANDSKRRLIYNSRIAPDTVLFFFHRGPGQISWSVRNYSSPGSVAVQYASEFKDSSGSVPSASQILAESTINEPAPVHPTSDLAFWYQEVSRMNRRLAGSPPQRGPQQPLQPSGTASVARTFEVLNEPALRASKKAGKRGDLERILHSENSEDYVTWNFFELLSQVPASSWWPRLLDLAGIVDLDRTDLPCVQLWRTVPAPVLYERASRDRMRMSANPDWRRRSLVPSPVEGPSEIDITLEGVTYRIVIEAKLGSDVSLHTTYDPERNQVARNIDCALETRASKRPLFWILAKDRDPARAYTQLAARYAHVENLTEALPHRNRDELAVISPSIRILVWQELLPLLDQKSMGSVETEVYREIERRVQS